MKEMTFDSKIFIKPNKKKKMCNLIINLFLALFSIITFILILMEGISINRVGGLCLAWIILSFYKSNKEGYQFSVLTISVMESIIDMIYENVKAGSSYQNIRVIVDIKNIKKVEYSEKLKAIRIVGHINIQVGTDNQSEDLEDWVIYSNNHSEELLCEIEKECNVNIEYVDRKEFA